MLTRELMGLLGLAILWVNTLLVVGAAWGPLRDLLRRLRVMRELGLLHGEVLEGDPLATHIVDQVGRKAADDAARRAIMFHDRGFESVIAGGRVRVLDGELDVAAAGDDRAEVWLSGAEHERAGACPSSELFDEAYASAKKAKGFRRELRSNIAVGAELWLVGARDGDRLTAPEGAKLLVSTLDPKRFCRGQVAQLAVFMLFVVGASAAITLVCLWPPVFGTVSTVGGAVGLVYFLLVQPAGTMMRDRVLVPSRRYVRGSWVQSGSEGQGAPTAGKELYAD